MLLLMMTSSREDKYSVETAYVPQRQSISDEVTNSFHASLLVVVTAETKMKKVKNMYDDLGTFYSFT